MRPLGTPRTAVPRLIIIYCGFLHPNAKAIFLVHFSSCLSREVAFLVSRQCRVTTVYGDGAVASVEWSYLSTTGANSGALSLAFCDILSSYTGSFIPEYPAIPHFAQWLQENPSSMKYCVSMWFHSLRTQVPAQELFLVSFLRVRPSHTHAFVILC